MKPILQTVLYGDNAIGTGNCVAAAMASILEIPLWMMPPWEVMFARPDWNARRKQWLNQMFGLDYVVMWPSKKKPGHYVNSSWEDDSGLVYMDAKDLPEFYIACGPTERGSHHAVVYSHGALVHDPHYSGAGLLSVDRVEFFRKCPEGTVESISIPSSAYV